MQVPIFTLDAHCGARDMLMYNGSMFPSYQNDLLIIEHGSYPSERSWPPTGFKISRIKFDKEYLVPYEKETFVDFVAYQNQPDWNKNIQVEFGKLTSLTLLFDGSLLIADEGNLAVYRIVYNN